MVRYAATYPQLMNQALDLGLGEAALTRLRTTYDLAEAMTDGVYRAQSVPFVCHLVRAASIVLACGREIEAVQVAMIHGAYRLPGFRDSRRRKTGPRQRRAIRERLGEQVEALLWTYDRLPWYRLQCVRDHLTKLPTYDLPTKQAVLIRLADYLDDHLDCAMAYAGRVADDPDARAFCEACQALARELGAAELADDIATAYEENVRAVLPESLVMHRTRGYERPRRHLWERPVIASAVIDLARATYRRATRQQAAAGKTYGGTPACGTAMAKADVNARA